MDEDEITQGDALLNWWLPQLGVPRDKLAALGPDFLVISPPKTGSTWLAANLRAHPKLFVPAVKEVKYFSSFFKALDLNWYLDQFSPGAGRVKGEASPSYALLPVERIRLVRQLLPRVKVIFLMRDPIARAWSHAKHNYRFKEANFIGRTEELDAVIHHQWQENLSHEWPLACGDYLGQLRRWLAVFPREQLFVGFYEAIVDRPATLLCEIFAFLGVDAGVDLSAFPVHQRLLPGLDRELPAVLERALLRLLHARTVELASFLRENFHLETPPGWRKTLAPPAGEEAGLEPAAVFARQFDDKYLARVLAQEQSFSSARCPVHDGYRGYNLFFRSGRVYALEQGVGAARPEDTDEDELRHHQDAGRCFIGLSVAEVKERVDQRVFDRVQGQQDAFALLQADLQQAQERITCLEHNLAETAGALGRIEAHLARRPWYRAVPAVFHRTWRLLRAA